MRPEDYGLDSRHFRCDGMTLIELAPTVCPAGHVLAPGETLVGREACYCSPTRSHRTWTCRCGAVAIWPGCVNRPQWTVWNGI